MQLRLQRSQRAGGVLGNTIFFCLDVRADYAPEEQGNIRKYKLGSQIIYNSRSASKHLDRGRAHLDRAQEGDVKNRAAGLARGVVSLAMAKMSLNISIASLGHGHHIECKDLEELLEAEDTVRDQCKNVTRYLEAAATFNGSEVVVDYVNGEEKVHIAQGAVPLLAYAGSPSDTPEATGPTGLPHSSGAYDIGRDFGRLSDIWRARWLRFEERAIVFGAIKGWTWTEIQVRFVSGLAVCAILILLYEIL
jgi:hypothetical protein